MVSINGIAQSSNDPLYDINMNNYRIVAYMNQNDLVKDFKYFTRKPRYLCTKCFP